MTFRIVSLVMLLISAPAWAEPSTQPVRPPVAPTSQPSEDQPNKSVGEVQKKLDELRRASDLERNELPAKARDADEATRDVGRLEGAAATSPSTQPLAKLLPTTNPATQASAKFPTPAELAEKFKQLKAKQDALTKVAYFDIDDALKEKPAEFSLFGTDRATTLRAMISRLRQARDDKGVRAVLITLGAGASVNFAQAQEIRDTLVELRRAGKKTFVYADSYDTTGYTIASGATNVCMLGGGEIMIPGVGLETMYYKGTFDKIGVLADYVQIGEYKGAEEPYTRSAASDELRGELTKLTEGMYDQIVDGISLSRGISRETVKQLIDDTIVTGAAAKDRGLVDHLIDADGLRQLIKEEVGNDVTLVHNYGAPKRDSLDFSNPFALLASLSKKPEPSNKPAVGLIYAEGVITDGDGEGGLLGESGVGSEAMRKAFRIASRDENVKAVVVRIDSPGGSALASEVMWQAMRRLAKDKPVVVSIGSMAASGGYYLASAGDYIFADPVGIVGSIGVVGGKFVMKDLFEKIGLSTENYTKGRNADLFSSNQPFSERQKRMVRNWMQQTYDQFTQRVMTTRQGKISDIDRVARGRIFLAQQAKQLGMVDELGGIEAAIAHAADQAELSKGQYEVRTIPQPKTLADLINGSGDDSSEEDAMMPLAPKVTVNISADSILRMMPAPARRLLGQQIQMMQLMEKRPVVLMSPFVVTVK